MGQWTSWPKLVQFLALLYKNTLVAVRNWKGSIGQLLTPIAVILLLLCFQGLANFILEQSDEHPLPTTIGSIPKCKSRDDMSSCTTLLYSPKGVGWVDTLMQSVAEENGLVFGVDVFSIGGEDHSIFALQTDYNTTYNYVLDNQNKTQNVVFFTSAYGQEEQVLPEHVGYILFYNYTFASYHHWTSPAFEVMRSLDEMTFRMQSNNSGASFTAAFASFPKPKLRISGLDVVAAQGGIWFYVPPMITFFVFLTEIVAEKESRLRLGMRMVGMRSSLYWLSWFIVAILFVIMNSLVLVITGLIFQISIFANTNFFVVFLLFFIFGMAMISWAFFLSTFISRSKTAQTVGYASILVGFVFQSILCSGYGMLIDLLYNPGPHEWVKAIQIIFQLYPPFDLSKAYSDVAVLSSSTMSMTNGTIVQGPGFKWSDLYKQRIIPGNDNFPTLIIPAPILSYWYMLMDAAIVLFLTWYLDNVLPGEQGSSRSPLFFLSKTYWGIGGKRKKELVVSALASNVDERSVENESSSEETALLGEVSVNVDEDMDVDVAAEISRSRRAGQYPLQVSALSKTFRRFLWRSSSDVEAVKELSLAVEEGEIMCILGPNGAGKTTFLSMLTGILSPTSGSGFVYGMNLLDEMDEIHRVMNVAPQHRLKGLSLASEKQEIESRLHESGLVEVAKERVATFSGGMKRRLSVAVSFGMDIGVLSLQMLPAFFMTWEVGYGWKPENCLYGRAFNWDGPSEQDMKRGRVIILTTHSMEEAEVLGDRVGIMVGGRLKCIGTPLHLKNKYGQGYRVSVVGKPDFAENLVDLVHGTIPDAALTAGDGGNFTLTIPSSSLPRMPQLLDVLQHESRERRIREWGVSHSTLEDVFMAVATGNEKLETLEEVFHDLPPVEDVLPEKELEIEKGKVEQTDRRSYPFRASFLKNFSILKRQKGSNCCQIVTPVFVMLILLVLQLVIRAELGSKIYSRVRVDTLPFPLNVDMSHFTPFNESLLTKDSLDAPPTGNCLEFFLFEDSGSQDPAGSLGEYNSSDRSGLLGRIAQHSCILDNGTVVNIPYYLGRTNASTIESELFDDLEELNKNAMEDVVKPPLLYLTPDGSVLFHNISSLGHTLNYTIAVNDHPMMPYHRANNFTRLDMNATFDQLATNANYLWAILEGRMSLMSMLHDAFSSWVLNKTWAAGILQVKSVQALPYYSFADVLAVVEIVGTMLFPLALTLQLPIHICIIAMEKEDRLRMLMQVHGLRLPYYFCTIYVINLLLYAIVVAFFWLTGWALKIRLFCETDPFLLLVFLIGWGLSLISMGFFVAAFLNSKRAATLVGYIIALMGTLFGLVICVGIYGIFPFSVSPRVPWPFLMIPQFAMIRGIFLMNTACALLYQCFGPITKLSPGNELSSVLIALYVSAVVYFVLSLYLDAVLPQKETPRKHPLFFLKPLVRLHAHLTGKTAAYQSLEGVNLELAEDQDGEDEDVTIERRRVKTADVSSCPLVLVDLSKVYPPRSGEKTPNFAVQNLSFAVEVGDCFGLLGENGAGKTTTLSMLTGMIEPTSGHALVDGFNIATDISQAHLIIGVCPQHSVLWEDLTVEETLLFFARLKGIGRREERGHVRNCISRFGLLSVKDRLAKYLSGGMKRRLSVAIALIGDSKIVFLDEPTTGLDPASRRQLWKAIVAVREHAAVILSTHSMEEAETLCSRIGIMSKGKLKCLGSPLHLKNKFVDMYKLSINYAERDAQVVQETVLGIFPEAVEISSFRGTREYRLQIQPDQVGSSFAAMERSQESGITDWSLAQLGLDDVFHRIVNPSNADL